MTHLKISFLLIFIVAFMQSQSQILMPLEKDSAQIELERQMEYFRLIGSRPESSPLLAEFELPTFDLSAGYDNPYKVSFDFFALKALPLNNFASSLFFPGYSPFFANGKILSEAAYQLGDKFILGGYSYGVNSVLSAPFPAGGNTLFDHYGSTLFMQYKVSKNFKIETRVNVSQGR